jgi:hypothetical protein
MFYIPYLIVFVILFFFHFVEKKLKAEKKSTIILYTFIIFIVVVFFGFRGFVYTDFISYYSFFNNIPSLYFENEDYNGMFIEPLFIGYVRLVKTIYNNYHFFIFISSLIDIYLLYKIFKKYIGHFCLPMALFIAFQGLIFEFNLMRNIKSLLIFLLSIEYLINKKSLKYFSLNIIGILFHFSSIIYIPIYFILNKKFNKLLIFSVILFSNIIFFSKFDVTNYFLEKLNLLAYFDLEVVANKINSYSKLNSSVFSFGYLEKTIFLIIILIFMKDLLNNKSKYTNIFFNSFIIYYGASLIFTSSIVLNDRIPILFIYSYWFLIPFLFDSFKNKNNKILIITYIFLISISKVFVANSSYLSKYENILIDGQDYLKRKVQTENAQ